MRTCSESGCPELVKSGTCATHSRAVEQRRGSAAQRGYGRPWARFRQRFIDMLIAADITPACGASLLIGPNTKAFSQCVTEGRLTTSDLHLDHEPPLTQEERADRSKVNDPRRVGFLCPVCHSRKTRDEQTRGIV